MASAIAQIQAAGTDLSGLGSSISGVDTTTLADKVTNVLVTLGISMKDGITNIKTLATESFTTKTARINGLEMVDKATGDIYCTWIENGEWQKAKGDCSSPEVASSNNTQSAPNNSVSQDQIANQVKEDLQPVIQSQVQAQVQQQVQTEVQNQLQSQQAQSTSGSDQTSQGSSSDSGGQSNSQQTPTPTPSSSDQTAPTTDQTTPSTDSTSSSPSDSSAPVDTTQPQALFDILTSPAFLRSTNNAVTYGGLVFVVIAILFIFYRVDRRRLLKKIEEIKRIKELP